MIDDEDNDKIKRYKTKTINIELDSIFCDPILYQDLQSISSKSTKTGVEPYNSDDHDMVSDISTSNFSDISSVNSTSEFTSELINGVMNNIPNINTNTDNSSEIYSDTGDIISHLGTSNHILRSDMYDSDDSFIRENEYKSDKEWKNEEETRSIFEELFYPIKFKTVRLKSLRNPYTNKRLELDGLCRIKKKNGTYIYIGFEYQGEQHREYIRKYHSSKMDLEKQIMRDHWKRDKCERLGFKIIEVWYDVIDKRSYILNELKQFPDIEKYYKRNIKE